MPCSRIKWRCSVLLAIPLAVLIKLLIVNMLATYKRSVYYRQADAVRDSEEV